MNRKQFLEICQRVSVLPDDVRGVKRNITPDLTVNFDCMRFYPGYIQSRENQTHGNFARFKMCKYNTL